MADIKKISTPTPFPDKNLTAITNMGGGTRIPPQKRLESFSDAEYTSFTTNWLFLELENGKYSDLKKIDGANDKGRDLVAERKDGWDNYQLKNYSQGLMPGDLWVEFGKIIYHSFNDSYEIPKNCFFLCPFGVGPSLEDLFNNKNKLKEKLSDNWYKHCQSEITSKKEIKLEGKLKQYFDHFDFSIFKYITPSKQILKHQKTDQYPIIFGIDLPSRPSPEPPPKKIKAEEITYINKMIRAIADKEGQKVKLNEVRSNKYGYKKVFEHYRICFYRAETFKRFARDYTKNKFYSDYEEQIHSGIKLEFLDDHQDGYQRMSNTCKKSQDLQFRKNMLGELKSNERVGICHHLANDDKLDWVNKDI